MRVLFVCFCLFVGFFLSSGCCRNCKPGMFFEDKQCEGDNCPVDHNHDGQNK